MNNKPLVTVFTATYNREKTLGAVYQSLCNQTFKDFEWIIVNDGSQDGTEALIEGWLNEKKLDIRYFYQQNNGKHIATNKGLEEARGEYFVNIDSDDIMKPNALETFVNAWNSIPENERGSFMSVKARCFNPENDELVGKPSKEKARVGSILDMKYKEKMNFEMWSMYRTSVRREYPNPDIRGGKNGGGLRFFPEGIWQDRASRKYKTLFIADAIRGYTQNTSTSLMGYGAKYDRSRENIHLWTHVVNDDLDYFFYDPKSFIKAIIGVSMDGFLLKKSLGGCLKLVDGGFKRMLVLALSPIGYLCYLKRK